MSSIDTAAIRTQLAQTGRLNTSSPDDHGFVSDAWRQKIVDLCNAIDSGATSAVTTEQVEPEQAQIDALIEAASRALHGPVPSKWTRAIWLIAEATPRMRTLNNAASSRWLALADAFLRGEV